MTSPSSPRPGEAFRSDASFSSRLGQPREAGDRRMVTAIQDATLLQAAIIMRNALVDELAVVDRKDGEPRLLGTVSAWNIVAMVIATGLDHTVLTLGDIVGPMQSRAGRERI